MDSSKSVTPPREAPVHLETIATCDNARAGILHTRRGEVHTPAFMAVATQATVKALSAEEVAATGGRMIIMNTYHLWLRPGAEVVREQGGLHEFSRWPFSIVTDSGGFQAFSLAERTRLTEDGFEFASHLDGTKLLLSPEESMRVQGALGSDIAMQLDVCPPAGATTAELISAVERTTRWAKRCLSVRNEGQAVFGIVQGGTDVSLRLRHAEELAALPLDGLALGGFSVGEPRDQMVEALSAIGPCLDFGRPRYLMGVGTPLDLLDAIACGVDIFDCVLPTRNARNGQAFVRSGKVTIRNARYRSDSRPLEENCDCPACAQGYTRSYLRHLYVAQEILAHRLITMHNLCFYQRLVKEARQAIIEQRYASWAKDRIEQMGPRSSKEEGAESSMNDET